jgi:hypothetical protein
MTAADAVVLPMPMSPVTRQRAPPATASAATAAPTSRAWRASSTDIAGPHRRLAVPGRTLRWSNPGAGGRSEATPTSTTTTSAPAWRASTFTAAPPAQKAATIWAVTSWGQGVTPSTSTP